MNNFRVDDIIKYFITGTWIYFLLHENGVFPGIVNFNNEWLFITISFSIGAISYYLFRTLLFPGVQMGLDYLWLSNYTGRNYLKNYYAISDWGDRNDVWILFHQEHSEKLKHHYSRWLFSFLTLYTLSASTFVAAICSLREVNVCIIYLVITIVFFSTAIYSNINYEKRLFNNITVITKPFFEEFIKTHLKEKSHLMRRPN